MNAIISNGDYTASVQLPVERKQLAGALSYLGKNHASAYDIKYNEESDQGLSFTLDCRGVVENAIAKAISTGFRFHTFNDTIALMHSLPYQSRREFENTVKVEGLASYEQLNRMLTEAYPQSVTTKYYCPLTIQVHGTNSWGEVDEDGYEEDASFAARHEDVIRQRLAEYNSIDENNMAEYFDGNNGVSEKLRSAEWGFIACMPCGHNVFGTQFERVLPASAVANCYPFNYSGKTDPHGFYLGRDKFGTNIIVDFDRRSDDKTNSNILILGNSGQGKSYLLKLILTNTRMSGKSVLCLDAEQEYKDLCNNLSGCYIDLMSGQYIINPLEPKEWSDTTEDSNVTDEEDNFSDSDAGAACPEAFRKATRLSQHISYLKDFFRVYKDFNDAQIDALEILLTRLYGKFGIHDNTDYDKLTAADYPIMADLYEIVENEYMKYEKGSKSLFTEDLLREI